LFRLFGRASVPASPNMFGMGEEVRAREDARPPSLRYYLPPFTPAARRGKLPSMKSSCAPLAAGSALLLLAASGQAMDNAPLPRKKFIMSGWQNSANNDRYS